MESQIAESRLQSECYQWFHNTYPELRGLLCYNLNNSRSLQSAMMDKGMGLQKGRSDMVFYHKGTATMIEMKTGSGRQTPDQKKWQKVIESAGFSYKICKSIENFKQIIIGILNT